MWSNFSTMWSSTDDQSVNSKTVTISVVLVPIPLYYCTHQYIKLLVVRVCLIGTTDDQSVNSKTVTISVVLVPISLYYCTRQYIKLGLNRVLSAARTEEESCHCSRQPLVAPTRVDLRLTDAGSNVLLLSSQTKRSTGWRLKPLYRMDNGEPLFEV
jgi:hypothetical protein